MSIQAILDAQQRLVILRSLLDMPTSQSSMTASTSWVPAG